MACQRRSGEEGFEGEEMKKTDGEQVYPSIDYVELRVGDTIVSAPTPNKGISRRDWLAGLAMQGMLSNSNIMHKQFFTDMANGIMGGKTLSEVAYIQADAMIAAGEEK